PGSQRGHSRPTRNASQFVLHGPRVLHTVPQRSCRMLGLQRPGASWSEKDTLSGDLCADAEPAPTQKPKELFATPSQLFADDKRGFSQSARHVRRIIFFAISPGAPNVCGSCWAKIPRGAPLCASIFTTNQGISTSLFRRPSATPPSCLCGQNTVPQSRVKDRKGPLSRNHSEQVFAAYFIVTKIGSDTVNSYRWSCQFLQCVK